MEALSGDATNPAFTTAVSADARVAYQTRGLPHDGRITKFFALQTAVLTAAQAGQATATAAAAAPSSTRPKTQGPGHDFQIRPDIEA